MRAYARRHTSARPQHTRADTHLHVPSICARPQEEQLLDMAMVQVWAWARAYTHICTCLARAHRRSGCWMQVSRPWCPWPHVAARTCHSCSTLCCRHIQIGTGGALCVRAGLCAQLHGATAGLCAQLHGATAARCHKHQHGAMSIGCTVPQASAARCHEHQLHGATSISTAPRASAARCHEHQLHGATSISCTVPQASARRHEHQLHGATSISCTVPRASAARCHEHQHACGQAGWCMQMRMPAVLL